MIDKAHISHTLVSLSLSLPRRCCRQLTKHVDDRVTSMVTNTIQSNRMPTDGGVQRGVCGAEEDRYIVLYRRCTYRTKKFYVHRSSGWRQLGGYSTVCTST